MKTIIGIDLGGTRIKAGLVSSGDFTLLDERSAETPVSREPEAVVRAIAEIARDLTARNGVQPEELTGLGLGCPGLIEAHSGIVLYSNNFRWHHVPILDLLQAALPFPVFVENDANCAVLGEAGIGAASGCKNVVLLTLGTGVGSGILVDGRLLTGTGCGGVAGHITLVSGGRKCTCGKRGCLEAYVSATALIRRTRSAMARHPDSALWQICPDGIRSVNGATAFAAAKGGDPLAGKIIREYLYYLGDGISGLISVFRPEKILLSGGICNEGDWFLEELNRIVRELSYAKEDLEVPETMIARLRNKAGIIGAASLVRYSETLR